MMFFPSRYPSNPNPPATHIMSLKLILPVNIMTPNHRIAASASAQSRYTNVFQLSYFDYLTTFSGIMRLRELV